MNFKRAIELAPDFEQPWQYLGEIELHKKNPKTAETMFCKAMNLNKNLCGVRYRLAQIAIENGQKQKAFELLKDELQFETISPDVLTSIGTMMSKLGEDKFAVHCFLEANSESEPNAVNYCNLGKMLANQGYFEDAQQFLNYALQLAPDDIEIIVDAAKAFAAAGNINQAAQIIEDAKSAHRHNSKLKMVDRYIKTRLMRRKIKRAISRISSHTIL